MPATSDHGRFEPIHAAHSIEQVQIAVRLQAPLLPEQFAIARMKSLDFKDVLPGTSELQTITVAFGGTPMFIPPGATTNAGLMLSRTAPNGSVEEDLRIENSSLIYSTKVYTRWADVWAKANRYFEALAPLYASQPFSAIAVNVIDKFVWTGAAESARASKLLRKGSQFLSPHIFQATDLWHSHTGSFNNVDAQTRRLLNVNVDFLDELHENVSRRIIAISTVLTDMYGQPGKQPLNVLPNEAHILLHDRINSLHAESNNVVKSVLSDEVCERIALKGQPL